MKGAQLWQHPFVDVFKYAGITEWRQCQKEGDVTETIDKIICKKVYKLQGSVSASNYIQIPKSKSEMKSLGLNGKFIYIELRVSPGKLFSLHLDLVITNTRTNIEEPLKISLSNLFKESKMQNSLQIACKSGGKWSVICIDLRSVLSEYFGEKVVFKELKMVTLCANMHAKGVYTSDILYNPKTLPKEMNLKAIKIEEWSNTYDWLHIPETFGNENWQEAEDLKNPPKIEEKKVRRGQTTKDRKISVKNEQTDKAKADKKAISNKGPGIVAKKTEISIKEHQELQPSSNTEQHIDMGKPVELKRTKSESTALQLSKNEPQKRVRSISKKNPPPETVLEQINEIPCVNFSENSLLPDPILELSNALCISPTNYSVLWAPAEIFASYPSPFKEGTNKFIFYISRRIIVALNPNNLSKTFFVGHSSNVTLLQLYKTYLVSADENTNIFFWPLKSRKNPIPLPVKKVKEITFFSFFSTKMIVSGKDDLNRDILLMYDTTKIFKKREIVHLSQQLSDFDIKVIKFYEETKLISCGKDSIRIWTYKDDHLSGSNISIPSKDQHGFSDLEITPKTAYVCSTKGSIFIISLLTREVEATFYIHRGPITRVRILEDIVMTSSEDTYLRLWPLDFHEVYMEVQHKTKVCSIDLLGSHALSLTEAGILGIIDLQNTSYSTLLRSFFIPQDLAISSQYMVVLGAVISILTTAVQPLCEFASPKDEALCTATHPASGLICCGFYSGAVRLFDIHSVKVVEEFLHHKAPIEFIAFSPDGKWMTSVSEDGMFSIYSGEKQFQPVKDGKIDVPCRLFGSFSRNSEYFAYITGYGGAVAVIAMASLAQKFKISINSQACHLDFSDTFLMVLAQDPSKMTYYQVSDSKVILAKEVQLKHSFTSFKVSANSRFIAAAGSDFHLRIYDLFFTACQTFLGHTSQISILLWEGDKIFSLSQGDGIFIWDFKGSLSRSAEIADEDYELGEVLEISQESEDPVEIDIEKEVEDYLRHVELINTNMLVPSKPSLTYMFGYSPVPGNIFWSPEKSCLVYTLGSMVVKTLLVGEKKQVLLQGHYNQIGALAVSSNQSLIATAEGLATFEGTAKINIWNMDTGKLYKVLEYHDKSVACLSFSPCSEYLCSIGNLSEPILAIWELLTGRIIATSILSSNAHSIKWLPQISLLEFATLSPTELIFWRVNSLKRLEFQPGESGKEEMTSMDFSPYFEDVSSNLLVIGTRQGSLYVCSTRTNSFIFSKKMFNWAVTCICCESKFVIIGGASAEVYMWRWSDGIFSGNGTKVLCDAFPTALSFNSTGSEGIVGTQAGSLWYIEWDSGTVRVMSNHSKPITSVCAGECIATASEDNTIRIWNPRTLDQDTHILVPTSKCLCLVFHRSLPYLVAGFHDGSIKAFEIQSSKCLGSSRSSLAPITCLTFTVDSDGLVLGTESGVIIAVIIKKWAPFTVDFVEFAVMTGMVLEIDVKPRMVLATTSDGVMNVWEKKYTGETLAHTKLFENTELQFNLIDIFDFKEPHERTKHIYPQADSLECRGKFDQVIEKMVWVIIKGAQYLIHRNYLTHQVTRKINLAGFPLCLGVSEQRVAVGLADRRVIVYFDGNVHEYFSHSDPVYNLAFLPGGFVTCASNEIGLWEL